MSFGAAGYLAGSKLMIAILFTILCIACVSALLWSEKNDHSFIRAAAKIGASAAFVMTALVQDGVPTMTDMTIILGLIFCAAGDAFLLSRGQRLFLVGMAAFAAGHAAYTAAFVQMGLSLNSPALIGSLVMALVAGGVLRWLWPHLGDMKIPVAGYVAIISVMVAASLLASAPAMMIAAAVGFAISDIAVARDRFINDKFANKLWGLPLYYGAQLLFAHSV